ncbi:MAG: response regulator transcription factor [Desulfofustis sp.]|jgi:DNA-binding response OmpR family regulator|nr:response regulator transcription factor [Desulfofustis sp.]
MNILIIDDEPELLEKLSTVLTREQYTVDTASDGNQALDKIWNDQYDLIVLDIMLPFIDGLEILKELRGAEIDTPVLMLSAKGDVDDRVAGLDLGADDYLGKPFSIAELLARIRALIRRRYQESPEIHAGSIVLDSAGRKVLKDDMVIDLTRKEFSILEFLLHNRGRAVSRFTLAEHVWGDEFDPFSMSNFIDVHLSNLRKKITSPGEAPLITTVRGFGYKIEK